MRKWIAILFLFALPAFGTSNRVFVKSSGTDTGACTPATSPCRSFSYAMTQVSSGGEIIALDTAGYGTFTATQSVTVTAAPGATAFIAVGSGGTGIDTTGAAASAVIVLRGLALSANGGSIGINFPAGQSLALENSIINGFQSYGVVMIRTNDTNVPRMTITNSTIRNNLYGVYTSNSGVSVTAGVTIANSSVSRNLSVGIDGADNTTAAVSDTVLAENNVAVLASSTASLTPPQIALERCTISRNGTGLYAGAGVGQVPHGTIRIAHNLITGNDTGVVEAPDGSIQSMTSVGIATNTIEGNGTDGTFSGSFAAK